MHNTPAFYTRIIESVRGNDDPELAQHAATCPECRELLHTIRMLDDARQLTGTLPDLPAQLATTLQQLLPKIRPDLLKRPLPSNVTRIQDRATLMFARLIFDSTARPGLAGLRGVAGRTRQITFVSDLADLDLELSPIGNAWSVTGQLGMDVVPDGVEIRFVPVTAAFLDEDDAGIVTASISADGWFHIVLPSGNWVASAMLENATIVFRDIAI